MVLMVSYQEELLLARDTLILKLQKLVSASIVKNSCERFNFYLGEAPKSFRLELG